MSEKRVFFRINSGNYWRKNAPKSEQVGAKRRVGRVDGLLKLYIHIRMCKGMN